jgi:hypothetical protein
MTVIVMEDSGGFQKFERLYRKPILAKQFNKVSLLKTHGKLLYFHTYIHNLIVELICRFPLGRSVTKEMVEYFLKDTDTPIKGVEKAFAIAMTLSTIGRAGELSLASFKQSTWNSIQDIFEITWNEKKTSKQHQICFYHDSEHLELDIYFLLACYLICGAGSSYTTNPAYLREISKRGLRPNEDALIFPGLVCGDAASTVSSYVIETVGKIPSLSGDIIKDRISSRGFRYGGTQEVSRNPSTPQAAAVFRGGWESNVTETNNTSSTYTLGNEELLWMAGKAIAGYRNVSALIKSPTCDSFLLGNENLKSKKSILKGTIFYQNSF